MHKLCVNPLFILLVTIMLCYSGCTTEEGEPIAGVDKIAFYSNRDGNSEIYVMDAEGMNIQRLTSNNSEDICPSSSPDGNRIVFVSDRDGNEEIYIMDSDGGNVQRLTDDPAEDLHPGWSADGTRIVFISERDGNMEIYVVNVDGSNLERLTNNDYDDVRPDWSPVDDKIVYNVHINNNYGIYVSSGNILRNNRMSNNRFNFDVRGTNFENNIDSSNLVNGKPIIYWIKKQNLSVPHDAGYVALINCINITIQGLEIENNGDGVFLAFTNQSRIIGNTIAYNNNGIKFWGSKNNQIIGNNIKLNGNGIFFSGATFLDVFHYPSPIIYLIFC